MGYESRLYIVDKSNMKSEDGYWAEKIAVFNLSGTSYEFIKAIKDPNKEATNAYFYEGDELIKTDKYGKPLTEYTIGEMITIIANAMKEDDYRRYAPCLALLNGFNKNQWGNLVVLHYGY